MRMILKLRLQPAHEVGQADLAFAFEPLRGEDGAQRAAVAVLGMQKLVSRARPEHPEEPAAGEHTAVPEEAAFHQPVSPKTFLKMAWLANPFAYVAINTVIAVMPGIAHASFHQKNYAICYHILESFFSQPAPIYKGGH